SERHRQSADRGRRRGRAARDGGTRELSAKAARSGRDERSAQEGDPRGSSRGTRRREGGVRDRRRESAYGPARARRNARRWLRGEGRANAGHARDQEPARNAGRWASNQRERERRMSEEVLPRAAESGKTYRDATETLIRMQRVTKSY